jgi:hypothetical protein
MKKIYVKKNYADIKVIYRSFLTAKCDKEFTPVGKRQKDKKI